MNVLGHGVDFVETVRIEAVVQRHGQRFLDRILTEEEQLLADRFEQPLPFIAGRWAAKEAILKVVGTGLRGGIRFVDMTVASDELGKPEVSLSGAIADRATQLGIQTVLLSITHTERFAFASALGLGPPL